MLRGRAAKPSSSAVIRSLLSLSRPGRPPARGLPRLPASVTPLASAGAGRFAKGPVGPAGSVASVCCFCLLSQFYRLCRVREGPGTGAGAHGPGEQRRRYSKYPPAPAEYPGTARRRDAVRTGRYGRRPRGSGDGRDTGHTRPGHFSTAASRVHRVQWSPLPGRRSPPRPGDGLRRPVAGDLPVPGGPAHRAGVRTSAAHLASVPPGRRSRPGRGAGVPRPAHRPRRGE